MSTSRQKRAANLERWADEVDGDDLQAVDTDALRPRERLSTTCDRTLTTNP